MWQETETRIGPDAEKAGVSSKQTTGKRDSSDAISAIVTHTHTLAHAHTQTHTRTDTYTRTHTHTHVHVHTHAHAHTHTHTQAQKTKKKEEDRTLVLLHCMDKKQKQNKKRAVAFADRSAMTKEMASVNKSQEATGNGRFGTGNTTDCHQVARQRSSADPR